MKAIDICAGAGGKSCGLLKAGVDVVLGVDIWAEALGVYRRNLGVPTREWDISEVPELPPVDAIVGGPPCTDFSSLGKRVEGERAALTPAFARIVARHRPRFFGMENVRDAIRSDAYSAARRILKRAGYGLSEAVIEAEFHGVPQTRRRLLLVGRLGGQDGELVGPLLAGRSKKPTTVRDHCGDRLRIDYYYRQQRGDGGTQRCIYSVDEVGPTITTNHVKLPSTHRPRRGDATSDLSQVRALTVREAAMLQTFPDDWNWSGVKLIDVWKMVGNAVPPLLGEHLGRVLLAAAKGHAVTARGTARREIVQGDCRPALPDVRQARCRRA